MIEYPTKETIAFWQSMLIAAEVPELPPLFDHKWVEDVYSCFATTGMRPDCKDDFNCAAAHVFFKVNKNHRRVDGNKRSSILSLYLFCLLNDKEWTCSAEQIEELALEIGKSEGNSEDQMLPVILDFLIKFVN